MYIYITSMISLLKEQMGKTIKLKKCIFHTNITDISYIAIKLH